eukprot:6178770-Pyramimonas_sp.AAC.1
MASWPNRVHLVVIPSGATLGLTGLLGSFGAVRITGAEVGEIQRKDLGVNAEQYWNLLKAFIQVKLTKVEFDEQRIVGVRAALAAPITRSDSPHGRLLLSLLPRRYVALRSSYILRCGLPNDRRCLKCSAKPTSTVTTNSFMPSYAMRTVPNPLQMYRVDVKGNSEEVKGKIVDIQGIVWMLREPPKRHSKTSFARKRPTREPNTPGALESARGERPQRIVP